MLSGLLQFGFVRRLPYNDLNINIKLSCEIKYPDLIIWGWKDSYSCAVMLPISKASEEPM